MPDKHAQVLILEDEPTLISALLTKFKAQNVEAVNFNNGQEALDYLLESDQLPKAIYLDYHILGLNGEQFMERLVAEDKLKNIPVIVVSNTAGPDKIQRLLDLGAQRYIVKAESRLDEIIKVFVDLVKKHA